MQPHSHFASYLITTVSSFIAGGGLIRFLTYVSKNLPPLPANSGWWTQLFYSLVKGTSGLDPSSTIVPPWDGKTDRRNGGRANG